MHGRVKTRTTAEEQEVKRKEREKKTKLYRAGIAKVFSKRQAKEYDDEILIISGQLLAANPDITTLWNVRREVVLHQKDKNEQTDEETQQQMKAELHLTEQCLRANPKSYGGWHHRMWVLDNMPVPNWEQELALCNKYLEFDERNFHCWDYRRFVVERSQVPVREEYDFSTKKILVNFSNYSSWHYRSKLLPAIFPDPMGKLPIKEDKHKEELELVQNAAFTDPNDQSAWFYQRWLLGRSIQPLKITQVCISQKLICVALTDSVCITNNTSGMHLQLHLDGQILPSSWTSTNGQQHSHVWISSVDMELPKGDVRQGPLDVSLHNESSLLQTISIEKPYSGNSQASIKPQFCAGFSEGITSVLQEELESCLQLLELEPGSKWTLLTTVLLMQAIDRHKYKDETFSKLTELTEVDPHRVGYYNDLKSRYEMEYALDEHPELEDSINLSHLKLTGLYHCQYLICIHTVDLSNNKLCSKSLPQIHSLQCCKILKLDYNLISSLQEMPALASLQVLSLQGNQISSAEEVKFLKHCRNLSSVDLRGNPVEKDEMLNEITLKMLNVSLHV